jgi:hypothetical protein
MQVNPVANVFPMMSDAEIDDLARDILENGQREPVWMYQGQVIDGRNRMAACERIGRPPTTREFVGADVPTYRPSAGTAGCYDVERCFASASALTVDTATCTAPKPAAAAGLTLFCPAMSGAVPPAGSNIAIVGRS